MPDKLDKISLAKGRLPKKNNEIVVEAAYLTKHKMKLGDSLKITDSDLTNETFKIVGTVKSPLYFLRSTVGRQALEMVKLIISCMSNLVYFNRMLIAQLL
jgi:putative ABC transport system permease protein